MVLMNLVVHKISNNTYFKVSSMEIFFYFGLTRKNIVFLREPDFDQEMTRQLMQHRL